MTSKTKKYSLKQILEMTTMDMIKLIAMGVNINEKFDDGMNALHYIFTYQYHPTLNTIDKENRNRIFIITCLLVAAGIDINKKDEENNTPLHYAARRSCTEAVGVLINAGAEINAENMYDSTPLILAMEHGPEHEDKENLKTIKILLNNSAIY